MKDKRKRFHHEEHEEHEEKHFLIANRISRSELKIILTSRVPKLQREN